MEDQETENLNVSASRTIAFLKRWKKWMIAAILAFVLVVVVALAGREIFFGTQSASGYQAVFLTNGQVYFGKLTRSGSWMVLRDIYYLQVTQPLQPAPASPGSEQPALPGDTRTAQPNIQLVKLGSELHGPQDEMYIPKDKILFWENLKDDSQVVKSINKYKESKTQ
jgi:hypothetical protein